MTVLSTHTPDYLVDEEQPICDVIAPLLAFILGFMQSEDIETSDIDALSDLFDTLYIIFRTVLFVLSYNFYS